MLNKNQAEILQNFFKTASLIAEAYNEGGSNLINEDENYACYFCLEPLKKKENALYSIILNRSKKNISYIFYHKECLELYIQNEKRLYKVFEEKGPLAISTYFKSRKKSTDFLF
jgi:hypothetical protein